MRTPVFNTLEVGKTQARRQYLAAQIAEFVRSLGPGALDPEWRPLSRCANLPPDSPFPESRGLMGAELKAARVRFIGQQCVRCDVSAECLAEGVATKNSAGVWGGQLPQVVVMAHHILHPGDVNGARPAEEVLPPPCAEQVVVPAA